MILYRIIQQKESSELDFRSQRQLGNPCPNPMTFRECAEGVSAFGHVEQHLLEPRPGFVPIGSPFMSFFHYEALIKLDKVEAMLENMRVNYGAMLAYGATTCWEMYPNYSVLRANPTFLTRSHCHAWSAGPLYFLSAYVLGVRPLSPGWTKVIVEPSPAGLSWATGSVPLPGSGAIDVSWSIEPDGKTMQLKVSAPWQVEVEARLPDAYEGSVDVVSVGKSASVSVR